MRELRKKQKRLYKFMKALIIIGIVTIVVYIGAEPMVAAASNPAAIICNYVCDFLVVANMIVIFIYYSKYGKSDSFLNTIEHEISDCGYYFIQNEKNTAKEYLEEKLSLLSGNGFAVESNPEIDEFDFAFTAVKRKEFFYFTDIEDLSREDVTAYLDTVVTDITVHKLKRSGNAVVCFVTDKAQEGAVALSKMITPLGKKEQIKVSVAIVELSSSRCYFLGNMQTKCQQMTASYILNCPVPIPDALKANERLPFQDEIEEKMKQFTVKEFVNGTFYVH